MAIKYRQEVYSVNDTRYRISIDDDTLASPSNLAFTVQSLFDLSYEGQNDDRFQSVIPSKCRVGIMVNSTDIEDLIEDMVNSEDGRFKLLIERYSKATLAFEKFWFGNVITDQINYEDRSYPFIFNMTAIDQLGTLSEIDYRNIDETYTGNATILEHINNILSKTDLGYFHNSTDNFIRTVVTWYEDNQVYNAGALSDPLVLTRINHLAFYREDEEGNIEYFNCLTVLKELALVFGARIYQSGGSIRFEQVNEREDADFYEFQYSKTLVQQGEGLNTTDTVTTNKTVAKTQLSGGQFSFLPGLKHIRLNYNHESNRNLLLGKSWNNVSFNDLTVGEIDSNLTTTTLNISSNLYVKLTVDTVGTDLYRIEFDLKFRFGNKYLERNITDNNYGGIIASDPKWEGTVENYVVSSERFGVGIQYINVPVVFETPVLPDATGVVVFGFSGIRFYKNGVEVAAPDTDISIQSWDLQNPVMELFSDGDPASLSRTRVYQVDNDFFTGNTQTQLLNTFIGDAISYVTRGKMQVYDGTEWVDSGAWSINQSGTTRTISELMIFERLAGQKRGTSRYNGSFQISLFDFHRRLVYASVNYLMMSGSFNAHQDTWSGSFFNLLIDRNNMTFSSQINQGGSNSGAPSGNSGGNASGGNSGGTTYTPPIPEFIDVTGATITGLTGTLPPNSLANQYLEIFRDGRKLRHTTDFTIDESNNEIDLVLQGMGENFEIKIY